MGGALAVAVVAALAGCGATLGSVPAAERAAVEQIQGPHAPAGTRITVRLRATIDAPLGPGSPRFEADLVDAVHTPDGDVLVPAGAAVRGNVSWTGSSARVLLDHATIDTPVGALALHATLRGAAIRRALAGPDRSADDRVGAVAARGPVATTQARSRVDESAGTSAGARFVLPAGSEVRLTLTSPLLAPSASVLTVR